MEFAGRFFLKIAAGAVLFAAGMAAGNWHAQSVAAQNKFGQPKTVVHVAVYKWKSTTSQNDKDQALEGNKNMAANIAGNSDILRQKPLEHVLHFHGVYAMLIAIPE